MVRDSDLVAVVERRLDFLERLDAEPLRKHELVDALGHSRSTVNRAIDELEAAGLVAGETDGYRTTLTGRLLARSYRRFLTVASDVDAASEVLGPLGPDVDLSPAALRDAETYRAAAPDPYRPLERLDGALVGAEAVVAALPALPYPRLLDRCRRVASAGGGVELALTERTYRHARDRYGDTLAGTAKRDGVEIRVVDAVEVGVLVADDALVLLVFDGDGGLHGISESTRPAAVEWGRERVRELAVAGHDVTPELAGLDAARADRADGSTGAEGADGADEAADTEREADARGFDGRLGGAGDRPDPLSEQGFIRVNDARLDRETDPLGPLRAVPSFVEVDAGHTLDRTALRNGSRESIADRLLDGLADGTDHALVGPAGCGKSTVCRTVAVRWHRSGRGPVLYRPSDGGEPFTATEALRERVTRAPGHALVVVEDGVDPDAADAFGVARAIGNRSDVSFLFDAREEPYDDPDSLPLTPADLAYRREIATVRMPRLDVPEVERFAGHVAELTGTAPPASPDAILDGVRRSDDERTDEMLRLVHHLLQASDTLDGPGPLEAAVDEAVGDLLDRPAPTTDVAVLVNLLNVAGVSAVRTLAYALAGDEADRGRDAAHSPGDPSDRSARDTEAIRRSLDRLEGTVLVPSAEDRDRTVHEEWSVLFLERLLDREPEPVVARRVGRAATRLLALADDPASRSRIRRAVGGDAETIDRIERDPEAWADETARALYGTGRRYPRLAPLFGRIRYSWIDLPSACSDALRDRTAEWVVRMYIDAGDLDGATDALDAWRPTDDAGEAERQRGYGDVARRRGEYDDARERFDRAAELFAAAGDHRGLAGAIRGRAQAAHFAGDYETAYEAASQAYAIAARIEDPIAIAKSLMDVANALDAVDGTDAVIEHYRVANELFRAYDDTHGAANVQANRCVTARRRGDLRAATEAGHRALDGYRTVGDEHREAITLFNLGAIAEQRGQIDEAVSRAREGGAIADRIGSELYHAFALTHLGSAAHQAGALDQAEARLAEAFDAFDALGADSRCASAATTLAEVAVDQGTLASADRWLERAETLLDDHAGRRRLADLERVRGLIAHRRGEFDRAETAFETAVEEARAGGFTLIEARALADRGVLAAERGAVTEAVDRLTDALELGYRIESARVIASAADRLGELLAADDGSTAEGALAVDAVGPIPSGRAADPAAYREVADRWRVEGDGVEADLTISD